MDPVLRLCEDTLSTGGEVSLPALPRMVFVVHGELAVTDRTLRDGEAWSGEGAVTLQAGAPGATLWRWEFVTNIRSSGAASGTAVVSREKLSANLATLPKGALLLRGDSVGFPAGGCAYLHPHQGPGIRCLLEGGIRIDTHGHSTSYGPGGAWYESGPAPVFAQAAMDRGAKFIRVMILRRALLGKSSIRYVNEADRDKPKSQKYQVFVDAPIAFRKE